MRVVIAVCILAVSGAGATTWIVDPYGTGQFATIQEAIDAASPGDIIELTDGTFAGPGNRDLDPLGKAITIRAQTSDPSMCVIDPTLGAPTGEEHGGFVMQNGETRATTIEGLTIMYGYRLDGGAVSLFDASPTFTRCHFIDNRGDRGGAVFCYFYSAPFFSDCRFAGNFATSGGGAIYSYYHTAAEFERCGLVMNNCINGGGGAIHAHQDDEVSLRSCTIALNEAAGSTGGVTYLGENTFVSVDRCVISDNWGYVTFFGLGEMLASCTDIWDNPGGDWIGLLAGQQGLRDNFSEDPLFCDPGAHDLRIDPLSPCAPEQNPACGLVGAYPAGCAPMAVEEPAGATTQFALTATSPATAAGGSAITFRLPESPANPVRITIHDVQGREIRTILDRTLAAGEHRLLWDGRTAAGTSALPGVYYCRLSLGAARVVSVIVLTD